MREPRANSTVPRIALAAALNVALMIRNMQPIELESTITCPQCGHAKTEAMPIDACQWFYECEDCRVILRPKRGDCCVFCSDGTVKCPPIQHCDICCTG